MATVITPYFPPWEAEPGAGKRGDWIRNAATGEWVALACGDTDISALRHKAMITAAPTLAAALYNMVGFARPLFTDEPQRQALEEALAALRKHQGAT